MMAPAVLFPDVELWATSWLRAALAVRTEPYVTGVKVDNKIPDPLPARLVALRRDGGARFNVALEAPRLAVNVFAGTEKDVTDLAALVRALIATAPNGAPVCSVSELSGPSAITDTKPRRYMLFELTVRGADL